METATRPVEAAPEEERKKEQLWTAPEEEMEEEQVWTAEFAEREAEFVEKVAAAIAERRARHKRLEEEWEAERGDQQEEELDEYDRLALQASQFREEWNRRYSSYYGCFEATTKIPNKLFTHRKLEPGDRASVVDTLQVFSLKIAKLRMPLQWPLHVFGLVAIRDCADHKRNIIFDRPRENCQIVTQEDPYLKLTGPRRPVVVMDPATFEIALKVKGTTESEDQWLSFLAVTYIHFSELKSHLMERDYDSKLSELQFQLGSIICSVEATIEVRITSGSWPHGLRAQFTANTASIPGAEIVLLDSGDNEVKPETGGVIKLSRCVVSVEFNGKLLVHVKALLGDKIVENIEVPFEAKTAGVSNRSRSVDFRKVLKSKTACNGEISKAKTAGQGNGLLGVDVGGHCTLGFNISWSVIPLGP